MEYGVVQGRKLGPIFLFMIYINTNSRVNLTGQLALFADDALFFFSMGPNWELVWISVFNDLFRLKKWFYKDTFDIIKTLAVIYQINLLYNIV